LNENKVQNGRKENFLSNEKQTHDKEMPIQVLFGRHVCLEKLAD
jgi:hypothetical protein